jgi:hypothetical protein
VRPVSIKLCIIRDRCVFPHAFFSDPVLRNIQFNGADPRADVLSRFSTESVGWRARYNLQDRCRRQTVKQYKVIDLIVPLSEYATVSDVKAANGRSPTT